MLVSSANRGKISNCEVLGKSFHSANAVKRKK